MTNNRNIIPTFTYAAYLIEGNTKTQHGIVSGATALEMIANSDAPHLLHFDCLQAINYDSSLTF